MVQGVILCYPALLMKPSLIKVALSYRDDARIGTLEPQPYRIEKLTGAVSIPWQAKPKLIVWHIGDFLTEQEATDLANTRGYEVTVGPRKEG